MPDLEVELTNPRASSGMPVDIRVSLQRGTQWRYSGASYLLLELLVEEISGQPFEDYVRTAILEALEMSRTGYGFIDTISNSAGLLQTNGIRVTGHPSLASSIGSDWVFWQSGTPDLFSTDDVLASMLPPGLAGTLVILIAAVLRRKRSRRTEVNPGVS